MFLFDCPDQQCIRQLQSMLRSLKNYKFAFDLTFFDDEIMTATVSEYLTTQRNCFENARTTSLGS